MAGEGSPELADAFRLPVPEEEIGCAHIDSLHGLRHIVDEDRHGGLDPGQPGEGGHLGCLRPGGAEMPCPGPRHRVEDALPAPFTYDGDSPRGNALGGESQRVSGPDHPCRRLHLASRLGHDQEARLVTGLDVRRGR